MEYLRQHNNTDINQYCTIDAIQTPLYIWLNLGSVFAGKEYYGCTLDNIIIQILINIVQLAQFKTPITFGAEISFYFIARRKEYR